MHTISSETFDKILSLLDAPFEEQEKLFNSLELNPYDNYDPSEVKPENEFMVVVWEDVVEEWIKEALESPHSYLDLPKEILNFIENGGQLSDEELDQLRKDYIEALMNSDEQEYAIIAPITDKTRILTALYTEGSEG